ncbi:MAG: hypothetical protein HY741_01430 [Chloroflexi bacterium]|nr:hypothetical protein [Chloroflexota bacterium]
MPRFQPLSLRTSPAEIAALDRFDWTEQIVFQLYGARIGVRTNSAAALRALVHVFPPNWQESFSTRVDWLYSLEVAKPTRSGRQPFHSLYSNAERLMRSRDLEQLVDAFERDMQLALAQTARRKVFVHAGVVGWRGRAIVIPGRTHSGKSTLVRELVRAGATYYSDEYAVLDAKGRVHPFARPLALRDEHKINQKLSFQELGGVIGKRALPVGAILVTKYRAGAKWRPKPLTPGIGALALLANTVTARTHQVQVLETLACVTAQATILKSARDEARVLAPQLLAQLAET